MAGLSIQEIAVTLGVNFWTVRHRARTENWTVVDSRPHSASRQCFYDLEEAEMSFQTRDKRRCQEYRCRTSRQLGAEMRAALARLQMAGEIDAFGQVTAYGREVARQVDAALSGRGRWF